MWRWEERCAASTCNRHSAVPWIHGMALKASEQVPFPLSLNSGTSSRSSLMSKVTLSPISLSPGTAGIRDEGGLTWPQHGWKGTVCHRKSTGGGILHTIATLVRANTPLYKASQNDIHKNRPLFSLHPSIPRDRCTYTNIFVPVLHPERRLTSKH